MKHRGLVIAGLVLLVAAALAGLFLSVFEHREVNEAILPHGAALYDPFLALELSQRDAGQTVVVPTTLAAARVPLHPGDTLLLGADAARVDAATAQRLLAWVRAGGHLLLVPGTDRHAPLQQALGLLAGGDGGQACVRLADVPQASELCGLRFHLAAAGAPEAAIGDARQGYLYARVALGQGRVSLLAGFGPVQHAQLKRAEAQAFAGGLLAPNRGRGTLYVVYALDGAPFLQFLAVHGWPALVALALLLAAWMARRGARLGPLLPAPAPARRALLEHVQAAGEFLYRRDHGRSLHRLACQAVLARQCRRDPACARLDDAAIHARLAERSGLELTRVDKAFQPPVNAQAFRASLITLARLGSHP